MNYLSTWFYSSPAEDDGTTAENDTTVNESGSNLPGIAKSPLASLGSAPTDTSAQNNAYYVGIANSTATATATAARTSTLSMFTTSALTHDPQTANQAAHSNNGPRSAIPNFFSASPVSSPTGYDAGRNHNHNHNAFPAVFNSNITNHNRQVRFRGTSDPSTMSAAPDANPMLGSFHSDSNASVISNPNTGLPMDATYILTVLQAHASKENNKNNNHQNSNRRLSTHESQRMPNINETESMTPKPKRRQENLNLIVNANTNANANANASTDTDSDTDNNNDGNVSDDSSANDSESDSGEKVLHRKKSTMADLVNSVELDLLTDEFGDNVEHELTNTRRISGAASPQGYGFYTPPTDAAAIVYVQNATDVVKPHAYYNAYSNENSASDHADAAAAEAEAGAEGGQPPQQQQPEPQSQTAFKGSSFMISLLDAGLPQSNNDTNTNANANANLSTNINDTHNRKPSGNHLFSPPAYPQRKNHNNGQSKSILSAFTTSEREYIEDDLNVDGMGNDENPIHEPSNVTSPVFDDGAYAYTPRLLDTKSFVSDYEEADKLLKQLEDQHASSSSLKSKRKKIKVTCNNCYKWRHKCEKVEMSAEHKIERVAELEQLIDDVEEKCNGIERKRAELFEANERLLNKCAEYELSFNSERQNFHKNNADLKNTLQNELFLLNKKYQSLVKSKNEIETKFELELKKSNKFDEMHEQIQSDLNLKQIQYQRIQQNFEIQKSEFIIKENELHLNSQKMESKFLELQKESRQNLDFVSGKLKESEMNLSDLTEENNRMQSNLIKLSNDKMNLTKSVETHKSSEEEIRLQLNDMSLKYKDTHSQYLNAQSTVQQLHETEQILRNKVKEQERQLNDGIQQLDAEHEQQIKTNMELLENERIQQLTEVRANSKLEITSLQTVINEQKAALHESMAKNKEWQSNHEQLQNKIREKNHEIMGIHIELQSQSAKSDRYKEQITVMREKLQQLLSKIEVNEQLNLELTHKLSELKLQSELKVNSIRQELNANIDEISGVKDNNARLQAWKEKTQLIVNEKEAQLHAIREENENLMDVNYEVKEEMSEYKNKWETADEKYAALEHKMSEMSEEMAIVTNRTTRTEVERDSLSKKSVRLKNRVKSLQSENRSLKKSITHLESTIDESHSRMDSNSRRLKNSERNASSAMTNAERLQKRLDRNARNLRSHREIQIDEYQKHHQRKDKKLDMVRRSNTELIAANEKLEHENKEQERELQEVRQLLKDAIHKSKMSKNKFQSEISLLTANNNNILGDKLEIEGNFELKENEFNENLNQLQLLTDKYKALQKRYRNKSVVHTNNGSSAQLSAADDDEVFAFEIEMECDTIFKLIQRCRNVFINTNKLSPKLIMHLIESCDKCLYVFYETKSKYLNLIESCITINVKYENIEHLVSQRIHDPSVRNSSYNAIENPMKNGAASASASALLLNHNTNGVPDVSNDSNHSGGSKKRKRKMTRSRMSIGFNNSLHNHVGNHNIICKPVQRNSELYFGAFKELYSMLDRYCIGAKESLRTVMNTYATNLNLDVYHNCRDNTGHGNSNSNSNSNTDGNSSETEIGSDNDLIIDWSSLAIDPQSETHRFTEMERNHKRFAEAIEKFSKGSQEIRKIGVQTDVALDVTLNSYYFKSVINDNNNGRRRKRRRNSVLIDVSQTNEVNEDTEEYFASTNNTDIGHYNQLMNRINVNGNHGIHGKRYSII